MTAATSDRDLSQKIDNFDATLRKISDSVPISLSKCFLVSDYGKKNKNWESYFYPPVMYHGSIPKIDLAKEILGFQSRGYSFLKGAVTHTNSRKCTKEELFNIKGDNSKQPTSENQEKYLLELLDHCKAKGYNVLFTRFPHRVENIEKYQRYCEGNYIADLVKEYGFAYLDCEHVLDTIGIDRIDDLGVDIFEIIDYKTSLPRNLKTETMKKSIVELKELQFLFYYLILKNKKDFIKFKDLKFLTKYFF